jgi:hypothetical protein
MRSSVQLGLLLVCTAVAVRAWAGASGPADQPADGPFAGARAVDPAVLDGYRGGFVTDSGIAVTLGIERIVTINGNVAEHSQIELGDLGRLTSGQSQLTADAAGQLRLIQNGTGRLDVQVGNDLLAGTIIQNSLNDQLIRNQTIINASVNARGLLQAMNFQNSLSSALNSAATGR